MVLRDAVIVYDGVGLDRCVLFGRAVSMYHMSFVEATLLINTTSIHHDTYIHLQSSGSNHGSY
jgi:hypothetical protein